jgi:POT family proton-dependent oligopeptide transporter
MSSLQQAARRHGQLGIDGDVGPGRPSLGHPRGLFALAGAAFCERLFTWHFYLPLLAHYLLTDVFTPGGQVLGLAAVRTALESFTGPLSDQGLAWAIYGLFNAACFAAAFAGGLVADFALGRRRSLVLGSLLMGLGYLLLIERAWLLLALPVLVVGAGCFRPNIAAAVSTLYSPDGPRREEGFYIYYGCANLGMVLSPIVCGSLGELLGWPYAFATAAAGMGCAALLSSRPSLAAVDPQRVGSARRSADRSMSRDDLLVLGGLCLAVTAFFAMEIHQANLMNRWLESGVDRRLWPFTDFEVPSRWLQQLPVNGLTLLVALPIFVTIWRRKARSGRAPSPVTKLALGFAGLGLGLLVLALAGWQIERGGMASGWLLVASTVTLTIGELYLSPVALALFTRFSPLALLSTLMAAWLLARDFLCDYLAAALARANDFTSTPVLLAVLCGLCLAAASAIRKLEKPGRRIAW